ncbi:hypothetical protein Sa4125_29940 [Aureimonas sp. SA4125]|uniref:hypothetical protein n=1 Tax=Aureimonas sp. SA4125 TaxID=2826993 RepID=UPI001CC519E3|nr:hypothetical protein [Aureimonas sp. SA4125]BDA85452.1 hypothetical protein Sa4125_29940 [Aureimonas sp. SA4125]
MTRFVISDPIGKVAVGVPFEAFLDIVRSSAIRSAATGDNFFEFGTSENVNVRFEATADGDIQITMFSTLNKDDNPPLRLQIADGDEPVSAADVERRIRSLRQAYAIAYMVDARRTVELARVLEEEPDADIEETCLAPQERLYIGTLTPGSMWLTLLTKSKKAYSVARYGLALTFAEGRMAFLDRLKADTKLKQLDVEERENEIHRKRHAGAIDTVRNIEKIKDPVVKQAIMNAYVGQIAGVTGTTPEALSTGLAQINGKADTPGLTATLPTPKTSVDLGRRNGAKRLAITKKEADSPPE